ncbi:MAG: GGDEF domain-containing protein [Bdellovibrionia bacterium]
MTMVCPPDSTDDPTDKTTVLNRGDSSTLNAELQKAKEQDACLIIIRGTPQGSRFFLTQAEMIIGRDPAAEISVADQSISRKHAKITKADGKVILTDLGSSNGTYVNDKKVDSGQSVSLAKEDMVKVGNSIFKFLPAGELEILFYGNLGSAAHTDPMTKIYNKGYLIEALDAEFKRAKALHTDLSLVFFDLDHFKKINDTYGHDAGDFVLKEITSLIRTSQIRPKDIFARYGGEEFVILLANTAIKVAIELSERIRASVESHAFIYEGKRLPVTMSLGVSELRAGVESSNTLLKAADKALYASKAGGRNRVTAME